MTIIVLPMKPRSKRVRHQRKYRKTLLIWKYRNDRLNNWQGWMLSADANTVAVRRFAAQQWRRINSRWPGYDWR